MRVIAGAARGRRLCSVPGETTRPITDRAKEALFAVLGERIASARVLDLFAGTGQVGIEALSRGAESCEFVERSAAAVRTIHANLALTGLADRGSVRRTDVFRFLDARARVGYDFIFVAPPQYRGLWLRTLLVLDAAPEWLSAWGTLVVQIHPRELTAANLGDLQETDRRQYGSVLLLFLARSGRNPVGTAG